jgi:hypothetical protein
MQLYINICFFLLARYSPSGPWPPHSRGFFLDHTQRNATIGRIPLDE